MQNSFELAADGRLGEGALAHGDAIQGALSRQHLCTEARQYCRHRRTARGRELMRNGIGVDHRNAQGRKAIGGGTLAAAYATSEADHQPWMFVPQRAHLALPSVSQASAISA